MKYIIITTLAALALHASGQSRTNSNYEWQRQQNQQREMEDQRVRLDQQRRQLQQLQEEQDRQHRRARRDCDDSFVPFVPRTAIPAVPRQFSPVPQGNVHTDRFLQRVMADPSLSHAAKMRICGQVLQSIK